MFKKSSIKQITSSANPTFKLLKEIQSAKGIRKHKHALLAGTKALEDVIELFPEKAVSWITWTDGTPPPSGISVDWIQLTPPLFKAVDFAGTYSPLLLISMFDIPLWSDNDTWPSGCTLFIGFQNPENVGAVIRSAAAFDASRVVLLKEAAHPFLPKSSRAAGPALFQVPLFFGPSISELSSQRAPLIGLDMNAPDIESSSFPSTFGFVAGIEGPGLPEAIRNGQCRSIAMKAGVESLNAATATAIALYVWRRNLQTL